MEIPARLNCPYCGFPQLEARSLREQQVNHFHCWACDYEWQWIVGDSWPAQFDRKTAAKNGLVLPRPDIDIDLIAEFQPLFSLSPKDYTLDKLDSRLNLKEKPQRDVGFGAAHFGFCSRRITYLEFRVNIYTFQNVLAAFHVKCHKFWSEISADDGKFKGYEAVAMLVNYQNDALLNQWQQAIEAEFGFIPTVEVPTQFAAPYHLLTSLFEPLLVGSACGYAGAKPRGCEAMLTLVEQRQVDLLRQILRCRRPEGRIYAAGGLLRLQAAGVPLMAVDAEAIEKLRHSPVMIETCSGCSDNLIFSHSALFLLMLLPVESTA